MAPVSARSVYLCNWQDTTALWMDSQLAQTDQRIGGPRLAELHFLHGPAAMRGVNQIVDYTGFFRDEDANINYCDARYFDSEAWFENSPEQAGILTTNYVKFNGAKDQPRLNLSRSYALVPEQPFIVVRYTLHNPTLAAITFNVLDQLHLNNVDPQKKIHAWYDTQRNALVADMSASGQFFVALGSLQSVDGHQVADDDIGDLGNATVSGWRSFDHDGTVKGNNELLASNVSLAFQHRVTIAPQQTSTLDFYLTIRGDLNSVQAAIEVARGHDGNFWLGETARAHGDWLRSGKQVHFADSSLNDAFARALIMIKNVQNPLLGTFAATTNPFAYGYKNWVRDASLTAIALDASGHSVEAERYWRWMAGVQSDDGTWKTTYRIWDGEYLSFVEPEYDSIGAFIYGVYRHYLETADGSFLSDLWPTVRRAADWIISHIAPNGLGAADFSIWEEAERGLEHNVYTQAWYVAGLYAAQSLAEIRGDLGLADWYAGGAGSILTALQRPASWWPPGLWNDAGHYNRAVNSDDSVQPMLDSSANILAALGVIDRESQRTSNHVETTLRVLTHDQYGLSRYLGDNYYYDSPYDPAGDEVLAIDPVWPQMSMWVAIHETRQQRQETALGRLQWFVATMAKGYMPHGEAVSYVTRQSVLSSMCEPLTASSFILAALTYEGQHSLTIVPPVHNAGTYKKIIVGNGVAGDWEEWSNVPYFVTAAASTNAPMTAIKRAYVTNDDENIYVRIDNASGTFSVYSAEPRFAFRVYSEDLANQSAESIPVGISAQPLRCPMSYVVERRSDSNLFSRWHVSNGQWTNSGTIESVSAPQWEPQSGRITAVIPIAALASVTPTAGDTWRRLQLVLARHDVATDAWLEDSSLSLHYRLSRGDQPWIYGNIER
jgi:GH15 family glucan-1,4-alpha-glucosidase